jgi:hypothetical protein
VDKTLWYEWWYYKVVIPETGKSFFFVYGVVNPWDLEHKSKGTRSYVGMGDFAKKVQVEEQFNVSDFSASYSETYVVIDRNTATDKFFNGSLKNEQGETYEWDVKISKHWVYNAEG